MNFLIITCNGALDSWVFLGSCTVFAVTEYLAPVLYLLNDSSRYHFPLCYPRLVSLEGFRA